MNPVFDPERYVPLLTIQHMLSPSGKRGSFYQAKAWLAERGIKLIRLGSRLQFAERAAVEAGLKGEPTPQPETDPTFDPTAWMPLADLSALLSVGQKRSSHRLAIKWAARNGVPVWRLTPRVALVPRAAVKDAMARQIERPAPPRRTRATPPYLRSKAQEASQAKAAKASSAYHRARREGRPFKKVEPLTGDAKVERLHSLADWGREARKAEHAGRAAPPVPEIDRTPAPRREVVLVDRPAPTPVPQPKATRRMAL